MEHVCETVPRVPLKEPRVPLLVSDSSVAMYLQSVMNGTKPFGPVKASSAVIAFDQKINLFAHEPTQSPAVCIVRSVVMRKCSLNTKNWKEPFQRDNAVRFAEAYGVRQQEYCHLVVATMAVLMLGGMCRYDDASGLMWRNARFLEDGNGFKLAFDKRKNGQYRQGVGGFDSTCGSLSDADTSRLKGAQRWIGGHVRLPWICRPVGVENPGQNCAGTGSE
jgi:hypothetical protein